LRQERTDARRGGGLKCGDTPTRDLQIVVGVGGPQAIVLSVLKDELCATGEERAAVCIEYPEAATQLGNLRSNFS
jgi:hypothetical protein